MMSSPVSPRRSRGLKALRVASLALAPGLAWFSAIPRGGAHLLFAPPLAHAESLGGLVVYVLGPLWLAVGVGLVARAIRAGISGEKPKELTALDRLDVLTASGSATLWASAAAIAGGAYVGWASLSVLGVAGLSIVGLSVIFTLIAVGGDDPMRIAAVRRTFRSTEVVEGEPVLEELHLTDARIPPGFALFATGSVGARWPVARYAMDASASGGEVLLTRDLGHARRGHFDAPPLELWLGDVLGLSRSVRRTAGAATLTVRPRVRALDGAQGLIGPGGKAETSAPTVKLPQEGSLRLREYQAGEDARRIHWMRSLSAGQVVVRLPDEKPLDRPRVRLVLDTFLHGGEGLTCDAHHELLDGMVTVWLGAARALAQQGTRVTLVTAATRGEATAPRQLAVNARAFDAATRLGAEVAWQDDLGVDDLTPIGSSRPAASEANVTTVVVSHRAQPAKTESDRVTWIVVPRMLWTHFDEPVFNPSYARLPHAIGLADNRYLHRRRERARVERARASSVALTELCGSARALPRGLLARPVAGDRIRLEALT